MAPRAVSYTLRALTALEFSGALGAWALGICPWPLAGAVSTIALVAFLLSWDEL